MARPDPTPPPGEFELIARYFRPLAAGQAGALGLTDDAALVDIPAGHQLVVTAEDGVRSGGAGAFLVDAMTAQVDSEGLSMPGIRVLGIPRQYLAQGKADDILASLGLDGAGIAESVRRVKLEVPAAEPPH